VGNAPRALAAGYGALWAASAADSAVRRVDLRGGAIRTIPMSSSVTAIAAGAGAVWVASEESRTVSRIEPQSGTVRTIPVSGPQSAVAVGEGAVWVASRDDGTLSRIDPKTNTVSWTIPVGGDPGAIAIGDGVVWVAAEGAGTVTRVDPRDRHALDPVAVKGSPAGIAVADGTAWVTAGAPASSHRGGTLRVLFGSESKPPISIDWRDDDSYDYWTPQIVSLAYDGLVAYRRVGGAAGGTLVGALATSAPAPIDGGLTYVFTLRPGLRYSDGRAVRPEDFRASMEHWLQVTRTEDFPSAFAGIVGAERCMTAQDHCDLSRGIETDAQARTITVHLTRPDSDFLHKLTQYWAYVVPADVGPRRFGNHMPPGTGPYRIAAWDAWRGGYLVRNPYYRGRSDRPAGFADRIEVHVDPPTQIDAQIARVQRGAADLAPIGAGGGNYSRSRLAAVQAASPGQVFSLWAPTLLSMALNVRRAPFDDIDVRRALNYATDRARVAEIDGGTQFEVPTCQILPPGFPAYEPYCPYTARPGAGHLWSSPDMEHARRLVARSGTAGQRVEVRVPQWKRSVGSYFKRLLDDLGYRASLRVIPDDEFDFLNPTGQVSLAGWGADTLAPSGFIPPLFECSSNPAHFCDRRYTGRLREALAAEGREARVRWAAIDRLLTDLAPTVPMTNGRNVVIVSRRAGNVRGDVWGPLLDQMWVR
jgi:peptide/nickel transport system substrate-binding protein